MQQQSSYDDRYAAREYVWGTKQSAICARVLQLLPPERRLSLLDIGCGEGRNAVYFASKGYRVTAFDLSAAGVAKTERLAKTAKAPITVFQANMNEYQLEQDFDILFSTGVFHLIPHGLRQETFSHYKRRTNPGGLNVFSVFVRKPFIGTAPDSDPGAEPWLFRRVAHALPRLEDRVLHGRDLRLHVRRHTPSARHEPDDRAEDIALRNTDTLTLIPSQCSGSVVF